jgi:hypothetical protein
MGLAVRTDGCNNNNAFLSPYKMVSRFSTLEKVKAISFEDTKCEVQVLLEPQASNGLHLFCSFCRVS